ncbi:hypothetical protein AeNC1_014357 [Aphanomyces euteiches]|nr:hypothetical protein AeNC1_014357 [Aphanomyces euteiches]
MLPKRIKVALDDSFELVLNGEPFVDIDNLFKSSSIGSFLSIIYKSSAKSLITDAKLPVMVVAKKDAEKGILCQSHIRHLRSYLEEIRLETYVLSHKSQQSLQTSILPS